MRYLVCIVVRIHYQTDMLINSLTIRDEKFISIKMLTYMNTWDR